MKNKTLRAFTLLELSIALVIIAVITGGILFGKTLLVSSRLQTAITDADNYITAANNFKQTYQALPGDFATAASVWGVNSNGCPAGGGTTGTCNGNGNGKIGASGDTTLSFFLFWQHLSLAKMVSQSFTGANGPNSTLGSYDAVPAVNVPAGAIKGSGYSVQWAGLIPNTGDPNGMLFPGSYGNMLEFGALNIGYPTQGSVLTTEQAASIDSKIDDGFPGTGKLRAPISTYTISPNCTTGTDPTSATYNTGATSANTVYCMLIFIPGW